MNLDTILLSFGIVCGIIPCLIWGRMGGDETFEKNHPKLRTLLRAFHHWMLGIIIMLLGVFTSAFILGWGLGTVVDDLLFHSFENYFERRLTF